MRVSSKKRSIKVSKTKFAPYETNELHLSNFFHLSLTRPTIIPQEKNSLIFERYLAKLMILASYLRSRINKIPRNQRKSQLRSISKNRKSKSLKNSAKKRKTSNKPSRKITKRLKKLLRKMSKKLRRL